MREQADIDAVRADLAVAVTQTLDPAQVNLWVHDEQPHSGDGRTGHHAHRSWLP